MVVRFPVTCRIAEVLTSLLEWSLNLTCLLSVILCSSGVAVELWLVVQFVLDYDGRLVRGWIATYLEYWRPWMELCSHLV